MRKYGRVRGCPLVAVASLVACVSLTSELQAQVRGDFNGDGRADLAIGVPSVFYERGEVLVCYGRSDGLTPPVVQRLDSSGLGSLVAIEGRFGAALTTGDFDADGYDDLVIGATAAGPYQQGRVYVVRGTVLGLAPLTAQHFDAEDTGTPIAAGKSMYGAALASGDVDGDGFEDLVVGSPGATQDGITNAGAITVMFGSATGVSATDARRLHQGLSTVKDIPGYADSFGASLVVADFNDDGFGDIGVGIPNEDEGPRTDAGAFAILYGSADGPNRGRDDQFWHLGDSSLDAALHLDDYGNAGASMTAGNFDGDAYADIAVGVPGAIVGGVAGGAVAVLYGTGAGLLGVRSERWDQDVPGVSGGAERADDFGAVVAAGDFDGDGRDELAVGVPLEKLGSDAACGAVHVFDNDSTGLIAFGDDFWHQDSYAIAGGREPGDWFGEGLTVGDFDGDGREDLAIGVPGEGVSGQPRAGALNILLGSTGGLTPLGNHMLHRGTFGMTLVAEERIGAALASGR